MTIDKGKCEVGGNTIGDTCSVTEESDSCEGLIKCASFVRTSNAAKSCVLDNVSITLNDVTHQSTLNIFGLANIPFSTTYFMPNCTLDTPQPG